jgi:hypothetical protein
MSSRILVRLNIALLSLSMTSVPLRSVASPPDFVGGDGTAQENREYSTLWPSIDAGQADILGAYDRFIESHPQNRPALLARAHLLMESGQVGAARADLSQIRKQSPDFEGLAGASVELAMLANDSQGERAAIEDALRRMQGYAPDRPPAVDPIFSRSRLAELKGDISGARKILEDAKVSAGLGSYKTLLLAELLMRHDQDAAAIDLLRSTNIESPDQDTTSANFSLKLDLVADYWATRRTNEALHFALESIDLSADPSEADRFFMPNLILAAHALSSLPGVAPQDLAKAKAYFDHAALMASVDRPYSLDCVFLAIAGKVSKEDVIKRLQTVLSAAPNLPWAEWAAVYMTRAFPNETSVLPPLLPPHSIFHVIAVQN